MAVRQPQRRQPIEPASRKKWTKWPWMTLAILIAIFAVSGACSEFTAGFSQGFNGASQTGPPTQAEPPTNLAQVGTPYRVTSSSGATANVTIAGVHFAPLPGAEANSLSELAVLDVEISGLSSALYHYSESDFGFQYASGPDPYRHSDDSNLYGVSPLDHGQFPPALGIGTLSQGKSAHGSVPIRMSPHSRLLVFMADEGDVSASTHRLAQWIINAP